MQDSFGGWWSRHHCTSNNNICQCQCNIPDIHGPKAVIRLDAGKTAFVVRALYGLKSAGASFCNHLANCMQYIGFTSCLANPDLWMMATEKEDGTQYMAYVVLYINDVMVVHHNALSVME